MNLCLRREGEALYPFDHNTAELIKLIPRKKPRYYQKNGVVVGPLVFRKFHKMIHVAFENQDTHSSRQAFRNEILIKAGHYDSLSIMIEDEFVDIRQAASITDIDLDRFREVFASCHRVILRDFGELVPVDFLERFY